MATKLSAIASKVFLPAEHPMKTNLLSRWVVTFVILIAAAPVRAQGTAFTYQGRLVENGSAYTGSAEFQATLWSGASGGTALASNSPAALIVGVTNGLFVLPLDFGANFPGANRWLQLEVRTTIGAFTTLTPRQPLTPAPYAITASNLSGTLPVAQLSGAVPLAQLPTAVVTNGAGGVNLTGTFAGNGAGLAGVNASSLNGLVNSNIWQLNGNSVSAGQFLGTTDTNALEFRVNGQRALRIEPATNVSYGYSPNIAGGFPGNIVSNGLVGAVIGGGGRSTAINRVGAHFATVVGGRGNMASGEASTAMGYFTTASGGASTAMGNETTASGFASTAMGYYTVASGDYSSAMGFGTAANGGSSTAMGINTAASGSYSTAMGFATTASGDHSTAMGRETIASGDYSIAMGRTAYAIHDGTFVWADNQTGIFNSTATNQFSIRASNGVRIEGGSDASLSSRGYLTLGPVTGSNLIFDNNEIMARNDGGTSTLFLNNSGGNVETGSRLGVGRAPAANMLEVEGNASKTTATAWLANSDARIKRDIRTLTNALEKLAQVRLVNFRYTEEYRAAHPVIADREYLNVVAQEFREVFPDAVQSSREKLPTGGDEILQVDSYPLTIYSAAAIQELNQKVESGRQKAEDRSRKEEDRIQKLEAENAALRERLERIEQVLSGKQFAAQR